MSTSGVLWVGAGAKELYNRGHVHIAGTGSDLTSWYPVQLSVEAGVTALGSTGNTYQLALGQTRGVTFTEGRSSDFVAIAGTLSNVMSVAGLLPDMSGGTVNFVTNSSLHSPIIISPFYAGGADVRSQLTAQFGTDTSPSDSGEINERVTELFADYRQFESPGWDGYSAAPVQKQVVDRARTLILEFFADVPLPDAAPGADGSIGLEWWNGRKHLFVDVTPDGQVLTYLDDDETLPVEEHFSWGDWQLGSYLRKSVRRLGGMFGESPLSSLKAADVAWESEATTGQGSVPTMERFGLDTSTIRATSERGADSITVRLALVA